jgi:hypothetical protein
VQTIADAIEVVAHDVQRVELFKKLRDQGVLAQVNAQHSHGGGSSIPVNESNLFNPDKFQNIDLRGVDASQIRFVDSNGQAQTFAAFVLALSKNEAKQFFQGTVYDEHTRFSADDTENAAVHSYLKNISSNYNGASALTEIKALVEPPSTRCDALLNAAAAPRASGTPSMPATEAPAIPTPPITPTTEVWQVAASNTASAATNTGSLVAPAATQPTASPAAAAALSSVIGDPAIASTLTGGSGSAGKFKKVMDSLESQGDEAAQVRWFTDKNLANDRLAVIKSLADIVADTAVAAQERAAAEQKAVALVQGWLRDQRNTMTADVFRVPVPQKPAKNPPSAGNGSAAAGQSAPATSAAAAGATPPAVATPPAPGASVAAATPAAATSAATTSAAAAANPPVAPSSTTPAKQEITIRSFAEAAKVSNPLSDDQILWLCRSPYEAFVTCKASDEEKSLQNVEDLTRMRLPYNEMIKRNLRISVVSGLSASDDGSQTMMEVVRHTKGEYFEYLNHGDQVFSDIAKHYFEGGEWPDYNGMAPIVFDGFQLRTPEGRFLTARDGSVIDILDIEAQHPAIHSNIFCQYGLSPRSVFIHWETDARVLAEAVHVKSGDNRIHLDTEVAKTKAPPLAHRIYLNPKIEDNARIFETIMTELNTAGLAAHGKVHARPNELLPPLSQEKELDIRTDGIVIAVGELDAQAVLDVVLGVWEKERDSFSGRDTPFVPLRIGDGIAIGSEPPSGNSLTGEIATVCTAASEVVREKLSIHWEMLRNGPLPDTFIPAFREALAELATEKGMNPDNLAFRLVQEKVAKSEQPVSTPNTSTPPVAERPYPSSAQLAHENAMREARSTGPTGDPDDEARQGRY